MVARCCRSLISIHDLVVIVAATLLITLQLDTFADDPGLGWHLKSGAYMLDTRSIPTHDPFLYSTEARSWVSDQWLSDLIMQVFYRQGSWPLLYAGGVLLYLFAFLALLAHPLGRKYSSAIAVSVAALLGLRLGAVHFILRPVLFGHLCFACALLLSLKLWRRAGTGVSLLSAFGYLCAYFALFVLWANLHPSFVIGLALLLVHVVALISERMFFGRSVQHGMIAFGAVAIFVSLLGTLINPYGVALHESIFSLVGSDYLKSLYDEWGALSMASAEGDLWLLIVGLAIASLLLGGVQGLKVGSYEILLFLVFGAWCVKVVRVLPFFGMAMVPFVAEILFNFSRSRVFGALGILRPVTRIFGTLESHEKSALRFGALAVVSIVVALSARATGTIPGFNGSFGPSKERFPYAAVEQMLSVKRDLAPVVFASPNWGGFITFAGAGKLKAIIDDRCVLFGESYYREYFGYLKGDVDMQPFLRAMKVSHLMLATRSALSKKLAQDSRYFLIHADAVATVFEVR